MATSGSNSIDPLKAATRLTEAVEEANTLLYYAVSSGQDLPGAVRDPIIKARIAIDSGDIPSNEQEAAFLDAYAKLALRVAPVTAATLDATNRHHERRNWLARLLGLRAVSDAQRLASYFGLLSICLIIAIAAGEWTHALIASITAAEKQFAKNSQEMSEAESRYGSVGNQIGMLARTDGTADTASAGAVREALKARMDELYVKIKGLDRANEELNNIIFEGRKTFQRMLFLGPEKLEHVGTLLGGFLLPVLYGALGTCAFVMRSLFREMVERTFDRRHTGEFTVRIFLGMLSGVTLQWLVVRSDGTSTAGVTPAVLAFLGGYSVEMLFTAMDRLVHMVSGRVRSPARGQAGARSRRERPEPGGPRRVRARDASTNGSVAGQRAPSPVASLAPVRAESG